MKENNNKIKERIKDILIKIFRGEIATDIFIKNKKISFLILLLLLLYIGNAIHSDKKRTEKILIEQENERLRAKKTELEFVVAGKSNVFEIEKKLNKFNSNLVSKNKSKKTKATTIIKYHVEGGE